MNKLILIFFISFFIISCQQNKKKLLEPQKISLNGNWEYNGFGKAITISDSIIKSYHISSAGNVSLSDNNSKEYFDYYTIDTLSKDTILLKDGVKIFKLYRSNKDFNQKINVNLANDPKYNFEVLWTTFNEQYCYFKERNVNWETLYKKYEPQIDSGTKPIELYLIFEKMLEEINDSHISIDVPDDLKEDYKSAKNNVASENQNENNGALENKVKSNIIEQYLEEPKSFNKGSLTYGKINNDIGYLQIQNMVAMAHYNIPDSLSNKKFWDKWWGNLNEAKNYHDDVREGTRLMMDSIIDDIGDVKAFIIDLRFNGGGFDDASVEILNHFVSTNTDFATKKVRLGNGFTEKQIMSLYPSKNTFNGKTYVLTSHQTASAAEVFVLGAKKLSNVKTIGSTTEGVFSDILRKKLPNGWTYGLSNMIYETMAGISYENVGIEPDHTLNYPKDSKEFYEYLYEDLKDGDEAIERVISEIKTINNDI
ncbi:S41 family peptidase [Aquimarina sp. AU474]|uniref:S41 family peptidase n=1 Tax=Aquimarina sp. AU474 TaxID=2108529 RepID=UPI000D68B4B3|nr:S41 family peptidase [Aquimarina sp. AU474]